MTDLVQARSTLRRAKGGRRRTTTRDEAFALGGGLNLVDPEIAVQPGFAREGTVNYEISIHGGYGRVGGFSRAVDSVVPGNPQSASGVTGVHIDRNGNLYAARVDNSPARDVLYKEEAGDWVQCTVLTNFSLTYSAAGVDTLLNRALTNAPVDIKGGTSGAIAQVVAAVGFDQEGGVGGYLAVKNIEGTFQASETLEDSASSETYGTLSGGAFSAVPPIHPASPYHGRWEFTSLGGNVSFGCNGSSMLAVIVDTDVAVFHTLVPPQSTRVEHITMWGDHLFIGTRQHNISGSAIIPRALVRHSGLGRPLNFTADAGANEYLLSDAYVRGFLPTKNALFFFTDQEKQVLHGTSIDDFVLRPYDPSTGAVEWSMQPAGFGMHLQKGGFTALPATDRFANFESLAISRLIDPMVKAYEDTGVTVTASTVARSKNLYRCFFSNGDFLSIGLSGEQVLGFMLCRYGDKIVRATSEGLRDGQHQVVFCTTGDPYIYLADSGTSFDGEPITATLVLPPYRSRRTEAVKRYRKARIEGVIEGNEATVAVTAHLLDRHGDPFDVGPLALTGTAEDFQAFRIDAEALSIALEVEHDAADEAGHALRAVVFHTSARGALDRATEVG